MNHILKCHDFIKDDIIQAENCYLYDKNNKKYVDFESGIWCTVVGHTNPKINRRIIQQINQVIHLGYGYTNYLAEDAAKSLLGTISEDDGKCVFLSSGSEAVEFGISVAKLITGKRLLLTLSESYLGAYGSSSATSSDWVKINLDNCLNCKEVECLKSCTNLEKVDFDEICAFVFEPGCSSGKVILPPEKMVRLLLREVKSSGGLIVVDEVTTGLGRTGKWCGFHHYGMDPDIIAFGKGLGNGYPVSAVTMRREIATELEKKGFRYAQSHQNDPLGCAIASEVIKVIRDENLVDRSLNLGNSLLERLNELKSSYSLVKEVRGRGLMAAVEFEEAKADFDVKRISNQMLKRGFVIGFKQEANLIRFMPPLTIEVKEIENMMDNLDAVLKENIH
jgi:acetylornithine/N-succinyldiaminopimelate aminotransferase